MLVGTEWSIDAEECDAELLRDEPLLRLIFARVMEDLGLKKIGDGLWHKFDGEGGITGMVMLTESHLACHTYPEHGIATFNLYCCRTRPEWNWEANLADMLGAKRVSVRKFNRGEKSTAGAPPAVASASRSRNSAVEQPESTAGVPPAVASASRSRNVAVDHPESTAGVPPAVASASRSRNAAVEQPESTAGVPPAVASASRSRNVAVDHPESTAGVPPAVASAFRSRNAAVEHLESTAVVPPAVASASRSRNAAVEQPESTAGVPPAVASASSSRNVAVDHPESTAGVPPAVASASRSRNAAVEHPESTVGVPPAVASASRSRNAAVEHPESTVGVPPAVASASRSRNFAVDHPESTAVVPPAVASASRSRNAAVDHPESTAGVPPSVASASRSRNAAVEQPEKENKKLVSYGQVKIRERGRLPHWEKEDGIYFVTFRLADSLPLSVLRQIEAERDQSLNPLEKLKRELSFDEKSKIDWIFSDKVDEYLDQGTGNCYMKRHDIAQIVADSLRHFDNERYHLFAWVIMPNHVHVVFRAVQKNELKNILHSWKSFSAHKINRLLNRTGEFWQREYYDHLVRDQEEFERIIQYVLDNPVNANLDNWQWVWAYGKYKEAGSA